MEGIDKELLVREYGIKVSRISQRMIRDKELAKEAAQEVWFEVLKNLNTFKGNSSISTWIYTIAKRTILRYAKDERIITSQQINECAAKGQIEYSEDEVNKEEWIKEKCDQCLTAFCHCLKNDARLIFLFRENLSLSYSEIAGIMEMSEPNIRKIASRSLQKMRNFLNGNCPLYNPTATCGCRIREEIYSIDFDHKYAQLREVSRLVGFYKKFDKELPRKNYWKKFLGEVVTK